MKRLLLLASVVVSACTVRLPATEPTMAPPPPVNGDVAPAAPKPEAQAPAPPPKVAAAPARKAAPVPKAPPPAPAAKTAPPPAPVAKAAPPPLDLRSLEERLKDTDAIGVLTKLSLKNQVDDLVGQFREYHAGKRPPTLAELRRPFELLLMKVLSLLQDKDATLAHDINASRDAIWGVLSDRDKLAQFT